MEQPVSTTTRERRITPGRVATMVVVVALVAMWIYAFSGMAAKDPPDLLDNDAFSTAAEPICADAVDQLDALPRAQEAGSPEERAGTVADANVILAAMVADLREIAPDQGDRDSRITGLWLDDWETHLADRAGYVEDLEDGAEGAPVFTARGGRSITATIDNFAKVNHMSSCVTPLDI
jgi:hypothetical protein